MSAFIVSGGVLLEIGCPSRLSRDTGQQASFTKTLGGKRKAFIRKGGRRAWSVDVSVARPAEVSTLEAVARGVGPYGWYPPEAVVGNLLSPSGSGFDTRSATATDVGLVQLPDGSVARAVAPTGTVNVTSPQGGWEMVPVRPGPVTVGGWGFNGIRLTGAWRDAEGATVGTFAPSSSGHSGWQWVERTITAPADAVFLSLSLSAGGRYARPSVAWGTRGRDELGTGCPLAAIHSPQHTPVALWEGANYTDSSYTVTEVG